MVDTNDLRHKLVTSSLHCDIIIMIILLLLLFQAIRPTTTKSSALFMDDFDCRTWKHSTHGILSKSSTDKTYKQTYHSSQSIPQCKSTVKRLYQICVVWGRFTKYSKITLSASLQRRVIRGLRDAMTRKLHHVVGHFCCYQTLIYTLIYRPHGHIRQSQKLGLN